MEWILVNKDTKLYCGWSKAEKKPSTSNDFEWIEWGREVPVEDKAYYYKEGKLIEK